MSVLAKPSVVEADRAEEKRDWECPAYLVEVFFLNGDEFAYCQTGKSDQSAENRYLRFTRSL